MTALIREEVPTDDVIFQVLTEAHQFVVVGVQILRILVAAPAILSGLVGGQFVPFLAGYLTSAARGAAGGVYQERLRHGASP